MDIMDLVNSAREYMRPGSTAVWTKPGQSYGPAVSRLTRTPINFKDDPLHPNLSGEFNTVPDNFLTRILPKSLQDTSQITVYPKAKDTTDISSSIRHEDTHATLDSLSRKDFLNLADRNPAYDLIEKKLGQAGRGGFAPAEVPAYMAETDPSNPYKISPDLRNAYVKRMIDQLSSIDPSMSQTYAKLARMGDAR